MPNQKLRYQVEVDTAGAVSDLNRLGTAGAQAGQDLGDGFKQGATQSEQALQALQQALTDVKTESQGLQAAVDAIKPHLSIDVDESTITQFVSDIRSKFGLAFDDVTLDAKQFADVLEQGVNLDKTSSAIRGVGTELDTVRDHGDQSRSVLANLAGNAAQDLGQLGGVVGSLGVGIGQLAEYAVDGNIALKNLAGVAGPMAGLAAAGILVNQAFSSKAAVDAFNTKQVDAFTEAIGNGEDAMVALREQVQETGQLNVSQTGIFGTGFFGGVADIIPNLERLGMSFADFQRLVEDPGALNALKLYREGLTDATQRSDLLHVIDAVGTYNTLIGDAAERQTELNRIMAETPGSLDATRSAFQDSLDPLKGVPEEMLIPIVQWLRNGGAATGELTTLVNDLSTATGLSTTDILAQAQAFGEAQRAAGDLGKGTHDVAEGEQAAQDAIDATTETLQGQVDALQEAIDKRQQMIDSSHDLADAQQAWDDALAALPGVIDETNKAMEENTAGSDDWLAARNEQRDAAEKDIDLLVEARKQQALANGEQLNAAQIQRTYAEGLGRVAGSLSDDVIPSVVDYYSEVLKIPTDKQTDFEMVLKEGDQAAIERFITLNSGTTMMSFKMQADQAHMNTVQGQIDGLAAPRTVAMSTVVSNDKASGQLAVIAAPRTAPVTAVAHTDEAYTKLNALTNPWFTTLWVTPRTTGSINATQKSQRSSQRSAPAGVGVESFAGQTPPATSSAPVMVAPRAGPTLNVTVNAAVIGNRYDVERAVVRAITQAQRMGRLAS